MKYNTAIKEIKEPAEEITFHFINTSG